MRWKDLSRWWWWRDDDDADDNEWCCDDDTMTMMWWRWWWEWRDNYIPTVPRECVHTVILIPHGIIRSIKFIIAFVAPPIEMSFNTINIVVFLYSLNTSHSCTCVHVRIISHTLYITHIISYHLHIISHRIIQQL